MRCAVIGAGASGILALIKLKEAGYEKLAAFEKAEELGGTWWYNRYPGVACDVPSHSYRYSFAPKADWSKVHSPGAEIHSYLRDVAHAHGVADFIRFNEEVVSANWSGKEWILETGSGTIEAFDFVISAVGVLHHPTRPAIAGLDEFDGVCVHTRDVPADLRISGKRIGIIGTGSTAVQIVSTIVGEVADLTLFQRTPQWIMPMENPYFTEQEKAAFQENTELMRSEYERLNTELNTQFAAAVIGENPEAYAYIDAACRANLERVRDPALRAALTPDYEVGCKRLVMAESFYEAIQRPNAHLVTNPIERIEGKGVRTADGHLHEVDILFLATGFDPHSPYGETRIQGVDGISLAEAWSDGAAAYKQVMTAGFPNWFMIGGPGSPIGNFSFLLTAETQIGYIMQLIERLVTQDARAIDVKESAQAAFNLARLARMKDTIWESGCTTWYRDKNGNVPFWPWNFAKFKSDMAQPDFDHYQIS